MRGQRPDVEGPVSLRVLRRIQIEVGAPHDVLARHAEALAEGGVREDDAEAGVLHPHRHRHRIDEVLQPAESGFALGFGGPDRLDVERHAHEARDRAGPVTHRLTADRVPAIRAVRVLQPVLAGESTGLVHHLGGLRRDGGDVVRVHDRAPAVRQHVRSRPVTHGVLPGRVQICHTQRGVGEPDRERRRVGEVAKAAGRLVHLGREQRDLAAAAAVQQQDDTEQGERSGDADDRDQCRERVVVARVERG